MTRTPLQYFAESVAAASEGSDVKAVRDGVDAGAAEWIIIVELIMTFVSQILEKCNQPAPQLYDTVHNPGLWDRVRLRRAVREACVDCCGVAGLRKANDLTNATLELAAQATPEEVYAVVKQVRG